MTALDPAHEETTARRARFLLMLFVSALAIRFTYVITLFATTGTAGLMGVDSFGYLANATAFAELIAKGNVTGLEWLGSNPNIMPLFNGILALCVLTSGALAPLVFVLIQGVVDAGTCVVTHRLAGALDERIAKPAAILAAINPTQVVLAGLLYTDTLFLFFTILFLLGAIRWLRAPSWRFVMMIALALGGAALTRVLVVPWAVAMFAFMVLVRLVSRNLKTHHIAQIAVGGAVFGLCIGLVTLRNATLYGSWSLTAQSGVHLNLWIVPLIKEMRDGTPWAKGFAEMERRKKERFPMADRNPFVDSEQHREIALEELRIISPPDIMRAWLYGAAINIVSPAIIISPPVQTLPRTGFYATTGSSMPEKIMNFLFRSENALYVWILMVGAAGVAALRIVQAVGFFALLRQRRNLPALLLLGGWCVFIILINGPIASPKYRLPIEPVLMVAAGAGFVQLRIWLAAVRRRP